MAASLETFRPTQVLGIRRRHVPRDVQKRKALGRYPSYPHNQSNIPPPTAAQYSEMLRTVLEPMLAASPSLPLRLLTVSGNLVMADILMAYMVMAYIVMAGIV